MHLCQNLEQMTGTNRAGRRYRQDWRVVTYRVCVDPWSGELRWERYTTSDWTKAWGGYLPRVGYRYENGKERAWKKHGDKTIPVIDRVRHLSKVTKTDAAKLTGLPSFNALDYLKEYTHPDDPAVQNYVKKKTARVRK